MQDLQSFQTRIQGILNEMDQNKIKELIPFQLRLENLSQIINSCLSQNLIEVQVQQEQIYQIDQQMQNVEQLIKQVLGNIIKVEVFLQNNQLEQQITAINELLEQLFQALSQAHKQINKQNELIFYQRQEDLQKQKIQVIKNEIIQLIDRQKDKEYKIQQLQELEREESQQLVEDMIQQKQNFINQRNYEYDALVKDSLEKIQLDYLETTQKNLNIINDFLKKQ